MGRRRRRRRDDEAVDDAAGDLREADGGAADEAAGDPAGDAPGAGGDGAADDPAGDAPGAGGGDADEAVGDPADDAPGAGGDDAGEARASGGGAPAPPTTGRPADVGPSDGDDARVMPAGDPDGAGGHGAADAPTPPDPPDDGEFVASWPSPARAGGQAGGADEPQAAPPPLSRGWEHPPVRRTVGEHRREVLERTEPLEALELSLLDAHGCAASASLPDLGLRAGERIGPADVARAAAEGLPTLVARPRPRVAVLVVADEPTARQMATAALLVTAAREAGCQAHRLTGPASRPDGLREAVQGALTQADAVLVCGALGDGRPGDMLGWVLMRLGEVRRAEVVMDPGGVQAFGHVDDAICVGLPPEPLAAAVAFELVVRPALRRLAGLDDLDRPRVAALADAAIPAVDDRPRFVPVQLHTVDRRRRAALVDDDDALVRLQRADGLAEVPPGDAAVQPGTRLAVHLLG